MTFFGPPPPALGTYDFASVRSFVRSCVTARSENPFIGLFWFFAQSCGLWMWRKWRFRILVKKSCLTPRGVFVLKIPPFWAKMAVWGYIFEISHQIFLKIFRKLWLHKCKEVMFSFFGRKFKIPPFGGFLYSKYPLFEQKWLFEAISLKSRIRFF